MTDGHDFFPADMVKIGVEINKGLVEKDGNAVLRGVIAYLKNYDIKVDAEIAAQVPIKHPLRVISTRDH